MTDVLMVGALHWDTVVTAARLPRPDETLAGSAVSYAFGGKGGNQAVAAARHGARVAMQGRVGADDAGAALLAALDAGGVDRSRVRRSPGPSGMSVAILDADGAYGAVTVTGANAGLVQDPIDLPRGCRLLLLQNEVPEMANRAAVEAARSAGARIVHNAAPARKAGLPLAPGDVLMLNRVEAGLGPGDPPDRAAEVAKRLAADGPAVIVTLGGGGAVMAEAGCATVLAAHPVGVVSTHGAGDAFCGALAARLAAGDGLHAAAGYAMAAAALHVARGPEARNRIIPADVRALMA